MWNVTLHKFVASELNAYIITNKMPFYIVSFL